MQPKIQRFCWFDTVAKNGEARDNIWKYKRAIEGHKLVLVEVQLATNVVAGDQEQHFQVYDGHTYSHWGSFPLIYDQSSLALITTSDETAVTYHLPLNNWECKEVTMSIRNMDVSYPRQFVAILWFYEVPMSKEEIYEYAVKQPRYKIRHGGMRTAEEGGGYG